VPSGAVVILGNPLDEESFASRVHPASTWVHLVGVPHPTPRKVEQFKAIDPKSVEVAISVASKTRINHFIYVSVAHPAPMMKAYIEVRTRCEELLRASGMNCTIPPMVCSRPRAPVALPSAARLQGLGTCSSYGGFRKTPGIGQALRND
jgi:hypothetical protein